MKYPICLPIILASCALASLTNSSSADDKKVYNLATVVKISGINWFNYMETGLLILIGAGVPILVQRVQHNRNRAALVIEANRQKQRLQTAT